MQLIDKYTLLLLLLCHVNSKMIGFIFFYDLFIEKVLKLPEERSNFRS